MALDKKSVQHNKPKINPASQDTFDRVHVLKSVFHSLDTLDQTIAKGEIEHGEAVRRRRYLKWRILLNTLLATKEALVWVVKLFVPGFLIGYPSLWSNLKTLLREPQFKPLRVAFASWFMFAIVVGSFGFYWFRSSPATFTESISNSWPFTTSSQHTYDANQIEVTGGVAQLKTIDQTDSDNTSTGFGGGTNTQTQWDGSGSWVEVTGSALGLPDNPIPAASKWFDMTSNVLLMHFDEGDGATTFVDSKNANNGTCSGGTCPAVNTSGKLSNAFTFTSDYVDVPDSADLDIDTGEQISISLWVKPTTLTDTDVVFTKGYSTDTNTDVNYSLAFLSGKIKFLYRNSGDTAWHEYQTTNVVLYTGRWQHIAVTYTFGTAGSARLFLNGKQQAASWVTGDGTAAPFVNNDVLRVGGIFDGTLPLDGDIDEFALWKRTLSVPEVEKIYSFQKNTYAGYFDSRIIDTGSTTSWTKLLWTTQRPSGKELPDNPSVDDAETTSYSAGGIDMTGNILLMHMNETSGGGCSGGQDICDTSGQANHGTVTNATYGAKGKLGTGMTFDGTTDYIDAAGYDINTFSASAWIHSDLPVLVYQGIVEFSNASSQRRGISLNPTGIPSIVYGANKFKLSSDGEIDNGEWHHIVGTYDGTTPKMYIDGYEVTLGSEQVAGAPNAANDLKVGDMTATGNEFIGTIDEVSVWDRELSATEALNLYKRGSMNVKFHLRSCDDSACSGETFAGPSASTTDYFSELSNKGAITPSSTLTISDVVNNRYVQYRAFLETASSSFSPELKSVSFSPTHYYGGDSTIVNVTGTAYTSLSLFSETTGPGHTGEIRYQISNDGSAWYYYSATSTSWKAASSNFNLANTSSTINTNISTFDNQVGTGTFFFRAFFRSTDGTSPVVLSEVAIGGEQATTPTAQFSTSTTSTLEYVSSTTFTLTLSEATSTPVTVTIAAASSSTATSTGSFADYAFTTTTATFTAGTTSTSFILDVTDDAMDEDNETVILSIISTTNNAMIGVIATTTYTIIDDDDAPSLQFSTTTYSMTEASSTMDLVFQVSATSSRDIVVVYAVASSSTATSTGSFPDYTLATTTITIAGETATSSVRVGVLHDTLDEDDETVIVYITGLTYATTGTKVTSTLTILDNDDPPSIGFTQTAVSASEIVTAATATLQITATSSKDVIVTYTVSGTATGGGTDYTLANGYATTTAGSVTTSIPFTIVNDSIDEDDETIIITISSPSNATLGATTTYTYTIEDEDNPPTAQFTTDIQPSQFESTESVNIFISLSAASSRNVNVIYEAISASTGVIATGGGVDYTLSTTSTTITAGNTSAEVTLTIVDDSLDEEDEYIKLNITDATNATVGSVSSTQYGIRNDDDAPTVYFSTATGSGAESTGNPSVTVVLSATTGRPSGVSVQYATTTSGTATDGGSDYTFTTGTLSFSPGDTSESFSFTVVNDSVDEDNETVVFQLSNASNLTIGTTSTFTYTITDNDTAGITLSGTSVTATEGGSAGTYTIVLDSSPTTTVDIVLAISDGTEATLSTSSIRFTSANWNVPVTVSVSAVDDAEDEDDTQSLTITHTVSTTENNFRNVSVSNVTVSVVDNDNTVVADIIENVGGGVAFFGSAARGAFARLFVQQNVISSPALRLVSEGQDSAISGVNAAADESIEAEQFRYLPPAELFEMQVNTPMFIPINGTFTLVKVLEATDTLVRLEIESRQIVQIAKGVYRDIDTDGDTVKDIRVIYEGRIDQKPQLNILSLLNDAERNNTISVNSGAYQTDTQDVILEIRMGGVEQMAISNTSNFSGSSFQPVIRRLPWRLSDGHGLKEVYVRFRSVDGFVIDIRDTIWFVRRDDEQTNTSVPPPTGQESTGTPPDPGELLQEEGEPVGGELVQPLIPSQGSGGCALEMDRPYRTEESPAVFYVTQDCTKRPFRAASVYFTFFTSWDDVVLTTLALLNNVPDDDLGFMPLGPLYKAKEGTVVKSPRDAKIFILLSDTKYWITSQNIYFGLKFVANIVKDVTETFLNRYRTGVIEQVTQLPDYILFKYEHSPRVYRLEPDPSDPTRQVKRHIVSYDDLIGLNYDPASIVTLDDFQQYPDGSEIDLSGKEQHIVNEPPVGQTDIVSSEEGAIGQALLRTSDETATPAFTVLLAKTSSGEEVSLLQHLLQRIGFFPANIEPNSYFGQATEAALRSFQQANAIADSGVTDEATRNLLNQYAQTDSLRETTKYNDLQEREDEQIIESEQGSESLAEPLSTPGRDPFTLQLVETSRGREVFLLERLLQQLGFFPGTLEVDEYFDKETETAVVRFQKSHNLPSFGIVGYATRELLNAYYNDRN